MQQPKFSNYLSFRLTSDQRSQVSDLAKNKGLTPSQLVRVALDQFFVSNL